MSIRLTVYGKCQGGSGRIAPLRLIDLCRFPRPTDADAALVLFRDRADVIRRRV